MYKYISLFPLLPTKYGSGIARNFFGRVQKIYTYLILSLSFLPLFVLISVFLSLVDISFFDLGKKK
jgi:hypothetical protein